MGWALGMLADAGADERPPTPSATEALVSSAAPGSHGGKLVVALRAEPRTFNPATALDNPSLTVIRRMSADLIHVDRPSQEPVAALAREWTRSPDGLEYRLSLRRGVRFSDGDPFDADDVLFTFEVFLDPEIGSPHRSFLMPGGKPIGVEKVDSHTVRLTLAEPYAAGERLFDNLPILPEHRLRKAYDEGRLGELWGLDAAPEEIVGLGPFRLEEYVPGERVTLVRNPHYWKVDAEGRPLPYLDRLVFVFVADQTTQALRFQAGEVHVIDRLTAESFGFLRGKRGKTLKDLGPGLEYSFLFFNQNSADLSPELQAKQRWFTDVRFRRAVSTVADREGIAGLVYGDRARPLATHVTPGIKRWVHPDLAPPKRSPAEARRLLAEAGFELRGRRLVDADGKPVEFTLVTTSSNQARMDMATVIQEDLRQVGIDVTVVGLEFRALLERVLNSFDYEAALLSMGSGDTDPNALVPVLTSGGTNHLWQLKAASLPPWQQEIDRLMERQLVTLDPAERRRQYLRVQELVAEHQPMVFLVSPHVLTGGDANLGNFQPAVLGHSTLWNVDELFWRTSASDSRPGQGDP